LYTLSSGYTNKSQTWIGEYWCGDGFSNTTKQNDSVTTVNSAPAQPSLTNPDNNAYVNSITMNWSASSDADSDTVYYHVLVNGTEVCYTSDLNCSYNPSNSYYQWNVTPYDGTVNGTVSSSRYYTYDTTNPQLAITTSNNTYWNILPTIEGTASDTNEDSIYSNNTVWDWNNTYTNWKFTNITNIDDGNYHILITANDSAGNTNSSLFAFTYDTRAPDNLTIGKNDTTIKVNDSVLFYAQWSDSLAGLSHYIFSWNNSGTMKNASAQSLTEWSNITEIVNATETSQVDWIIYANDSAGNWNSTGIQTFTVAVDNTAPVIEYVSLILPQSVSAGGIAYISFTFNATDADGADNLNDSAAIGIFNLTSETTRTNTSCDFLAESGNTREYNCTIGVWYWDGAGDWTINATIEDINGAHGENSSTTFELQETTAMVMSPTSLGWLTMNLTDTNKTSNTDPIIINNTANKNITDGYVNVTAIDLQGVDILSDFIYANNFTVDIDTGGACSGDACLECDGTVMVNNTATAVSGATIDKGNNSAGDGQEELYFCLNGMLQTISAQTYSATGADSWTISVS